MNFKTSVTLFAVALLWAAPFGQAGKKAPSGGGKTLVLETQTIEGKIKRPQAALLALEKRPVFKPMALTQIDVRRDILTEIDSKVFENKVYTRPFLPEGTP